MARTPSNMLALGTKAPDFSLLKTKKNCIESLEDIKGKKGTVIMFICNHCPFVKYVNHELVKIANKYISNDIHFIAINSNDVINYPEDSPEKMIELADEYSFCFPYLFDETQNVAKSYDAACTPDFYLFDKDLLLVYRGQLDDARPGNSIPITGKDLRYAIENLIQNKEQNEFQKPSLGCGIKWK